MNVHKHARLTLYGRGLMVERIDREGWPVVAAAQAAGVSFAYRWLARARAGEPLVDRNSAPKRCPHRLPAATVAAIEHLLPERRTGPEIAAALGLPRSTIGAVLRRLGARQAQGARAQTAGHPL